MHVTSATVRLSALRAQAAFSTAPMIQGLLSSCSAPAVPKEGVILILLPFRIEWLSLNF